MHGWGRGMEGWREADKVSVGCCCGVSTVCLIVVMLPLCRCVWMYLSLSVCVCV